MTAKKIKFNLPPWVVVFLKSAKNVLITISAGTAITTTFADFPYSGILILLAIVAREFVSTILKAWTSQQIEDDDDK